MDTSAQISNMVSIRSQGRVCVIGAAEADPTGVSLIRMAHDLGIFHLHRYPPCLAKPKPIRHSAGQYMEIWSLNTSRIYVVIKIHLFKEDEVIFSAALMYC
jgi:hypothetical protein